MSEACFDPIALVKRVHELEGLAATLHRQGFQPVEIVTRAHVCDVDNALAKGFVVVPHQIQTSIVEAYAAAGHAGVAYSRTRFLDHVSRVPGVFAAGEARLNQLACRVSTVECIREARLSHHIQPPRCRWRLLQRRRVRSSQSAVAARSALVATPAASRREQSQRLEALLPHVLLPHVLAPFRRTRHRVHASCMISRVHMMGVTIGRLHRRRVALP